MRSLPKTLLIVALTAFISTSANAGGTFSGLGLADYGGSFSGISQTGVFGVGYNPAAALSDETSILLDVGSINAGYQSALEGEASIESNSTSNVPYIALTTPIGERLGLGFNLGVPYSRVATESENQSQRFHGIESALIIAELDSSLAYKVSDNLTVGVGAALVNAIASARVAMDTGAVLYSLFRNDTTESLIGDPALEGTRIFEDGRTLGIGGNVGFRYRSNNGIELTGTYRSEIRSKLEGKVLMRPINSLNLMIEGDLVGDFVLPMEAQYSLSVPIGPMRLAAEGSWVDWSSTSEQFATLENLVVVSDDSIAESLLAQYGLDDPELFGSTQQLGVNGFQDIHAFGARLTWETPELQVTAGAMYSPNATPDEWAHPANTDFQSVNYYGGALRDITDHLTLGLSASYLDVTDRVITNSNSSLRAAPGVAPMVPNGNGSYSLSLWRVGLSVLYSL